jgi:hypothetical protein
MLVIRSKSVEELPSVPNGTRTPMPCISEALTALYLNVRQRKLGTIITVKYSCPF